MTGLKNLIFRLHERGVEFVLAGGFGVVSHGSSLVTRDVDVVCRMEPENLVRLFLALTGLHPVHRMTPGKLPYTYEQAAAGGLRNLYLSTDWGQLDCLGEIKGLGSFEVCVSKSEILVIEGVPIRILTLDALIEAKRAMGRPRDLHAVLELEAIREKRRDLGSEMA